MLTTELHCVQCFDTAGRKHKSLLKLLHYSQRMSFKSSTPPLKISTYKKNNSSRNRTALNTLSTGLNNLHSIIDTYTQTFTVSYFRYTLCDSTNVCTTTKWLSTAVTANGNWNITLPQLHVTRLNQHTSITKTNADKECRI